MLTIPKLVKKVSDIKNYVKLSEDMKVLSSTSHTLNSINFKKIF